MTTNTFFPGTTEDGIRIIALPMTQTCSQFKFENGRIGPGYWTEHFFTTDPLVLESTLRLAGRTPDGPVKATADVRQQTCIRAYGFGPGPDPVIMDHADFLRGFEDIEQAARRVTNELAVRIRYEMEARKAAVPELETIQ